jgi:hypothetical protein
MYEIPRSALGLVQYAFRALGKQKIARDELCFFLAFQLHRMPPSKARETVDDLVSKGALTLKDGVITLSDSGSSFAEQQPEPETGPALGDLLRAFVSSSRLSSAVAIADNAFEIHRVSMNPLRIEALVHGTRDYQLVLDEAGRTISHDCPDWERVSLIRRFCKHVAKLFLLLDQDEAVRLLTSMRQQSWTFKRL